MGVEEIVGGGGRGELEGAAVTAGSGIRRDLLLLLLILLIGGGRLLLIGLLSLPVGGGLLLIGGGLLLLIGSGLLLLLRLLLLRDLRAGLLSVVVIVAAADQRQAGCADPGATRRAQQRSPTHQRSSHPLPVIPLAAHCWPPFAPVPGRSTPTRHNAPATSI